MMIKVKNYDSFEAYEMDEARQDYEMVAVVKRNGTVCADLMTECKSYKTALRRFFKALENDSRFDGWYESLLESCECGYFADKESYDDSYNGGWFFAVENYDGYWYICVNAIDETEQELVDEAGSSEETETVEITEITSSTNTVDTVSGTSLTAEEIEYFQAVVARVKKAVDVKIPIYHMDHEKLERKYRNALGICWAKSGRNGEKVCTRITIDEWFIHESYLAQTDPFSVFLPDTLDHVIAHEIAHIRYWRHGKKHTAWTEHIYNLIRE